MKHIFTLLVSVTLHPHILCEYNSRYFAPKCIPAKHCAVENSCYCSDKFEGWKNGGAQSWRRKWAYEDAYCYKDSTDCQCDDCGYWGAPLDQCQEERCDDKIGIERDGVCFHVDPTSKEMNQKSREWNFNCYRKQNACDPKICDLGKKLTGCQRVSQGTCTDCPMIADGYFWKTKGSCEPTRCTSAGAGKYIAKVCSGLRDSVIANCSAHPGNRDYIVPRQDGMDTYYCPEGGLVLPLPENSRATDDYTGFVCIDGYYLNGATCLPCLPGSACTYGRTYKCPVHYYTSAYSMSYCIRCSTPDECHAVSEWNNPIRCKQGSTANVGCVACGGCSWDPNQGLACVTESYEMQGLPQKCYPQDVFSDVAVCLSSMPNRRLQEQGT